VRVEHLDELGQFVGGLAAHLVRHVAGETRDVLAPQFGDDVDVRHVRLLSA
jgi:hypothetical protein